MRKIILYIAASLDGYIANTKVYENGVQVVEYQRSK